VCEVQLERLYTLLRGMEGGEDRRGGGLTLPPAGRGGRRGGGGAVHGAEEVGGVGRELGIGDLSDTWAANGVWECIWAFIHQLGFVEIVNF